MKLTNKTKMRLVFVGIALFFTLFGLLVLNRMSALNDKSTEMEINWLPSIIAINALSSNVGDYRLTEAMHVLSTEATDMAQLDKDVERLTNEIANGRKQYESLISSDRERATYQAFAKKYEEYLTASKETLALSRKNENKKATLLLKQQTTLYNAIDADLNKLIDLNQQGGAEASHEGDRLYNQSRNLIIAVNVFVVMTTFIFMMLFELWSMQTTEETPGVSSKPTGKTFFTTLTIKAKLRLAFLTIILLFIAIGILVVNRMDAIKTKANDLKDNWMPSIMYTGAIDATLSKYRINVAMHVLMRDADNQAQLDKQKDELLNKIAMLRKQYEPLISSPEEKATYQRFAKAYEEYTGEATQSIMSFGQAGEVDKAVVQMKRNNPLFGALSADLGKLVTINQQGGEQSGKEGETIFAESEQILIAVSIIVITLLILLSLIFERMISRPLAQLTTIIQRLAQGDTSVTHTFQNRYDEVGQIAAAVTAIIQTLQALARDSLELINSAQAGVLSYRADASLHPGEFGNMVSGMNQLLEVLSKPLTEVAQVMQQLALGELKGRMQGAYEGDLRALKANVNRSLDALVGLLDELAEVSRRQAQGDLTRSITGSYQGEFAVLSANVNQAIIQLKDSLQTIVTNTEHIAVGVSQTAEAATHVASQSSQQMSALDAVAVAIEESAASVTEISHSATQGNNLARSTAELAEGGRLQLIKLIEIIEQVSVEYNKIEQITGKISQIADKTHLLSLNAGLEAVRAGEHGLGFGFVAQQIGKLAEEAALSARDIGNVITSSSQSVHQSVTAAKETRTAIEQIAQAARDSGGTVQNISAAITQQSAAVQLLSQQVSQIQSSGEANASAAEQISNTMVQLTETVKQTAAQVQRFTLVAAT